MYIFAMVKRLYLLLGGDDGDVRVNFDRAEECIVQNVGKILRRSSMYHTEPWGFVSDKYFFNQAIEVETTLSPHEILSAILQIESKLGRYRKSEQYSSRTIDIDILFLDDIVLETSKLTIPHPRLHVRNFALIPLNEIAPTYLHPVFRKTVTQLLNGCSDTLIVTRCDETHFSGKEENK